MGEMEEKKQPTRKSSLVLVKPAVRKNSFVSFDDQQTTIGVQDLSDETDITASSNVKKISSEDDHPPTTNRKWTDSLETARRRKSRDEKERLMLETSNTNGT